MQTISIWATTSNVTSFPGSAVRTCWAQYYSYRLKRYPYPWSLGERLPSQDAIYSSRQVSPQPPHSLSSPIPKMSLSSWKPGVNHTKAPY